MILRVDNSTWHQVGTTIILFRLVVNPQFNKGRAAAQAVFRVFFVSTIWRYGGINTRPVLGNLRYQLASSSESNAPPPNGREGMPRLPCTVDNLQHNGSAPFICRAVPVFKCAQEFYVGTRSTHGNFSVFISCHCCTR